MLLDELPLEVLSLILFEVKHTSFQELCDLRLVSPTLAAAIEPLAFSCVKIVPCHNVKLVPQVQHLASGNTPNSRWTTRLQIDQGGHESGGRVPSKKDRSNVKPGPELEETFLLPAIEALRSVKRALYNLYPTHPYDGALRALAGLPALAELKITFRAGSCTSEYEGTSLPCYSFHNLRVLELEGVRLLPSIVESVKIFLEKNSTLLETLHLWPPVWHDGCLDYDDIPVVALEAVFPVSLPRLKSLAINVEGFSVSASSISIFPSICHLDLDNAASGTVKSGFWAALSDKGIQLQRLSVFPLTPPILRYLQSYSGLKALRLREPAHTVRERRPFKDTESRKVFGEVLAMHKSTLRHLAFEGVGWKKYGITEARLPGILTCKELETLWLVYHFPANVEEEYNPDDDDDDGSYQESEDVEVRGQEKGKDGSPTNMNMTLLLSALASNLSRLRTLTLEAKRRIPNLGWCGNAYGQYKRETVRAFVESIRQARASVNGAEFGDGDGIGVTGRCRFQIECRPLGGWHTTARPTIV